MMVGFVSVGIATLIGLFVGALAGYFGGWVDIVISRIIEVVICFPIFFLILSIMVWLPPSIWNVMIVIGLTRWTSIARYVRGEFIRLREIDFSVAASALGASHGRIIFRHIMPNALAPVFVTVTFGIASAILIEAGLSWLGFGVMPPDPSWGNILRAAFDNIFTSPHMVFPPCVAIFLAVLSYNLVGDALRDAIDPRLTTR
jgi:peptide/nickel transport system permease protein